MHIYDLTFPVIELDVSLKIDVIDNGFRKFIRFANQPEIINGLTWSTHIIGVRSTHTIAFLQWETDLKDVKALLLKILNAFRHKRNSRYLITSLLALDYNNSQDYQCTKQLCLVTFRW